MHLVTKLMNIFTHGDFMFFIHVLVRIFTVLQNTFLFNVIFSSVKYTKNMLKTNITLKVLLGQTSF